MANSDPVGTVYEDGSVKGGRRAGDSPDDFNRDGSIKSGSSSGWDEEAHPRDPTNGQWVEIGEARDEAGKQAQQDQGAAKNYDALLKGSSGEQGKLLSGMSDEDLQKLTAYIYSSETSDPNIVRGRLAVAAEMGGRGMDVKDHGAQGGGINASAAVTELTGVRDPDGAWRFDAALTAGAIPVKPPSHWFDDPGLSEPTALTVTADGRVYGHAAAWGVRHIGLPGHRTAPRSESGYRYYRTGQVETDDGSMVATGRITLGTGHADLAGNLTAASEHYDHTGSAVADVACGEDAHGIWYAGALRPGVSEEQIRTLRASSLSGDWRPAGHALEMVGLLAVNVPGFPTPRAALAASGTQLAALVAAGVVTRKETLVSAPTPPQKQAGPQSSEGSVTIGDTGLVGRVVEQSESGDMVVEVTVPASELQQASEEQAVAASAKLTTRQQLRSMTASIESLTEQLAARDRADKARELLEGLPAE